MAPLTRERRVYGWFADEQEQAVLHTIDMDGALARRSRRPRRP